MGDGGGGRGRILKLDQIGRSADGLKLVAILQPGLDGDEVHWITLVEQINHHPVEELVLGAVEVLRVEDVYHPRYRLALDQHRAQSCLLGLQALRRNPFQQRRAQADPSCALALAPVGGLDLYSESRINVLVKADVGLMLSDGPDRVGEGYGAAVNRKPVLGGERLRHLSMSDRSV